jgi:hypothetical protein
MGDPTSGVWIRDLFDSREFLLREKVPVAPGLEKHALMRLQESLSEGLLEAMQTLVQIAVDYCHADSSGISLEEMNAKGELQFRWVAVAGSFEQYLNGTTPRFYSPCGTCMDRGCPQHYGVENPYYNFLGVKAKPILDGLLIPWRCEKLQGTIWLVSHNSRSAFNLNDYEFLQAVAQFVSAGMGNPQAQSLFCRV